MIELLSDLRALSPSFSYVLLTILALICLIMCIMMYHLITQNLILNIMFIGIVSFFFIMLYVDSSPDDSVVYDDKKVFCDGIAEINDSVFSNREVKCIRRKKNIENDDNIY